VVVIDGNFVTVVVSVDDISSRVVVTVLNSVLISGNFVVKSVKGGIVSVGKFVNVVDVVCIVVLRVSDSVDGRVVLSGEFLIVDVIVTSDGSAVVVNSGDAVSVLVGGFDVEVN